MYYHRCYQHASKDRRITIYETGRTVRETQTKATIRIQRFSVDEGVGLLATYRIDVVLEAPTGPVAAAI